MILTEPAVLTSVIWVASPLVAKIGAEAEKMAKLEKIKSQHCAKPEKRLIPPAPPPTERISP